MKHTLWSADNRTRWYLLPDDITPVHGSIAIRSLQEGAAQVDPDWIAPYEVTEEQARRLAKDHLGQALDELRTNIDAGLAKFRAQLEANDQKPIDPASPITPNAASAILDLFTALPRVVGQGISGDDTRVAAARETMAKLQQRLQESGVDVDDRLQQFPLRLAKLRNASNQNVNATEIEKENKEGKAQNENG